LASINGFLDYYSTQKLWKAILRRDENSVVTLLKEGADPNLQNLTGQSALHLAVKSKSNAITQLLLDEARVINVSSEDNSEKTALDYAIMNDSYDIVRLLLERGAVRNEESKAGSVMGLLDKPALLRGPSLNQRASWSCHPRKLLSPACQKVCEQFNVTKTTFCLVKEQLKSEDKSAGKSTDKNLNTNTVEWRLSQRNSVYLTVYDQRNENPPDDFMSRSEIATPSDTWTWYHFPTNNVCYLPPAKTEKLPLTKELTAGMDRGELTNSTDRSKLTWLQSFFVNKLGINNIVAGEVHRGRTPHSTFMKPQASYIECVCSLCALARSIVADCQFRRAMTKSAKFIRCL
jgi:ankyrin repeat protein